MQGVFCEALRSKIGLNKFDFENRTLLYKTVYASSVLGDSTVQHTLHNNVDVSTYNFYPLILMSIFEIKVLRVLIVRFHLIDISTLAQMILGLLILLMQLYNCPFGLSINRICIISYLIWKTMAPKSMFKGLLKGLKQITFKYHLLVYVYMTVYLFIFTS